MPTVRKGSRQVSTMALPGVRLTAAETPESRGAGLAIAQGRTTEAIGELAGTVGSLAFQQYGLRQQEARRAHAEERSKANQVALVAAQNKLDAWELDAFYNKQTGALQRKGSDAFTLPEEIDQGFETISSEIEQGLGNEEQKLAFAKMKSQRGMNVRGNIERHVKEQREVFDRGEFEGAIQNKHSLAIANALDPRRVAQELAGGEQAITERADRLGLGPEDVASQINAFRSDVHVGVITNLLATPGHAGEAQHYFAETRDQIAGDKLDDVTKMVTVSNTRKQAQQETARILAEGGTFEEQRDKAKQIDDADVQDDVLARLAREKAIRQAQAQQDEEENLNTAYTIVSQTHDVDQVPPGLLTKLGTHRPGLESYARALSTNKPVETNLETYYRLKEQASTDPQAFLNQNLMAYRYQLGESEFKELTNARAAIRSGDAKKGDEALPGFRTRKQIADDTLTQYGLNPNAKAGSPEAQAIAQFYRMLDRRVDAAQQPDEGGKRTKVSNEEIQTATDDLLSQSAKVPGSWWNIWPGGKPFYDTTKRLIDVQVTDIPANVRADLERALRSRNRPVSDPAILDLYLEMQVR